MRYRYCPLCGAFLASKTAGDDGDVPYCATCDRFWFDTFDNVAIVMVVNEFDEIALLWQHYQSEKYSTFVSGYIKPGETAEETALREVHEEIGLDLESLQYEGTVWFERKDMLMHCFIGFVHTCDFTLSKEVDSAAWTHCEDVPKTLFPEAPGNAAFEIYKHFMQRRKSRTSMT